jgi:hypothetical protein
LIYWRCCTENTIYTRNICVLILRFPPKSEAAGKRANTRSTDSETCDRGRGTEFIEISAGKELERIRMHSSIKLMQERTFSVVETEEIFFDGLFVLVVICFYGI